MCSFSGIVALRRREVGATEKSVASKKIGDIDFNYSYYCYCYYCYYYYYP